MINKQYDALQEGIMKDEKLYNPNAALPFLVHFNVNEQLLSGVIFQRVKGGKSTIRPKLERM